MVRDILENPIYKGCVVQSEIHHYFSKNHQRYIRDSDEWIVVEDAFDLIVDKELWDKVQEVNEAFSHGKVTKSGVILSARRSDVLCRLWGEAEKQHYVP